MTAVQTEKLSSYHLNGIAPLEARKLGVSKHVETRIATAARVVDAISTVFPDQAASVAQVYDFEMQLTRFCAARGIPFKNGIVTPLVWHLMQAKMIEDRRFRPDGNYYEGLRMQAAEEMAADPDRAVQSVVGQMEKAAVTRHPAAAGYSGQLSAEEFYHKFGVDLTHERPRAGLFVPFQPGIMGYDAYTPEVNEGVYGLLSHVVRNRDYSHLFVEASELAEQGRGRRFFETPMFTHSHDGHLAAMAHPMDSDILYGVQFDNPHLLTALTFGGLVEFDAVRGVPPINNQIHSQIAGLPLEQRRQLV